MRRKTRRCIGFGDAEGRCFTIFEPDQRSAFWCSGCNAERMAHLDVQFAKLKATLAALGGETRGAP